MPAFTCVLSVVTAVYVEVVSTLVLEDMLSLVVPGILFSVSETVVLSKFHVFLGAKGLNLD